VQPVFDMIAQSAARLCEAEFCNVFRFDGQLAHFATSHGTRKEARDEMRDRIPLPPTRGFAAVGAILGNAIEQIPNVGADADYALREIAKAGAYGSIAAVPMLQEWHSNRRTGRGTITGRPFPFADQAVIAIEDTRLFEAEQAGKRELQESLQQQTATAEVLNVISRSLTELQPVLDAIVKTAADVCKAHLADIVLVEEHQIQIRASLERSAA
jgi:two-component system, NtrC family, sensor kinase